MLKAEICPFKDACGDTISCNKNGNYFHYEKCEDYASNLLYFNLAIPHVCPLYDSEKSQCLYDNEHCEIENTGLHNAIVTDNQCSFDYRICPTFSRWFWLSKKKR